jgi:hypothetical protein
MPQIKERWSESNYYLVPDTTQTAIKQVSKFTWFPNLETTDKVMEETKKQIDLFVDAREALEFLREIDFWVFRTEYFQEVYYYLMCGDFSNEMIVFLDDKWMDVIFLELEWSAPSWLLKVWDVFFSPSTWAIQLKEIECPWVENQWISFFTWIMLAWELVLLRISPEKCTFESYFWDPKKIWKHTFQFIKNIYGSYDVMNINGWIIYNINCVDIDIISRYSARFYLDEEKTLFIDFDWEEFWKVTKLDTSKNIDLSDVEEKITTLKAH